MTAVFSGVCINGCSAVAEAPTACKRRKNNAERRNTTNDPAEKEGLDATTDTIGELTQTKIVIVSDVSSRSWRWRRASQRCSYVFSTWKLLESALVGRSVDSLCAAWLGLLSLGLLVVVVVVGAGPGVPNETIGVDVKFSRWMLDASLQSKWNCTQTLFI